MGTVLGWLNVGKPIKLQCFIVQVILHNNRKNVILLITPLISHYPLYQKGFVIHPNTCQTMPKAVRTFIYGGVVITLG